MHPDFTKCVNGASTDPRAPEAVYAVLRRVVAPIAAAEPGGLRGRVDRSNVTSVVHEVWMRLAGRTGWRDRVHYCRVAARVARRLLIDEARSRRRRRSCSLEDAPTEPIASAERDLPASALRIDGLLRELRGVSPRAAEIAQLKLFGDPPTKTMAEAVGVCERTIERELRFVRAWMTVRLEEEPLRKGR
jgi:RNA polymerase sigma factor (TIGR02999 family)